MRLSPHQIAFSIDIAKLILKANSLGIGLTFGEAWRNKDVQAVYVETGASWTMNSRHLKRLAVDFNFFINGELTYSKEKLQELGDYWESLNEHNTWGGNWVGKKTDVPHFERSI